MCDLDDYYEWFGETFAGLAELCHDWLDEQEERKFETLVHI